MKGTIWCLHGAVGAAADWQGFAVPGWAVKRVDLWRFLDCCPMTMPEFGRALNAEARAAGGRNVLLGYSMGGRLALHALVGTAAPWAAAVLVSPNPGLETEAERSKRREVDAEWASRALSGDWAEFLTSWNAQPVLGGEAPGDRRLLEQRRREIARSFIDWSLGAQEPLWRRLGEVTVPALWVCGVRDEKFRALGARAVAAMTDAELAVVEGAGHRVPWDQPEVVAQVVAEWLGRVEEDF